MFTIDKNITDQKIKEKNMVKVFFSMNNHQVATPEMMLEEARSYIMFFREAGGQLSSCIGLHLLLTGRKLFYSHSSNPFPEGAMASVEEEAFCFVEGLGAMLDTVDFTKMSFEEKKRWIGNQEIFAQKPEEQSKPEVRPGEEIAQEAPVPPAAPPVPETPQAQQAAPAHQEAPVPPAVPPVPEMPQAQQIPPAPQPQQAAPAPQQPIQPEATATRAPQVHRDPEPPQTPLPQHEETTGPDRAASAGDEEPESYRNEPHAPPPSQQSVPSAAPEEAPLPQPARAAMRKSAASASSTSKQDIMQKAINAGIVKPPKPSVKKEVPAAAGVVSRDREALARLLTSF